ncbi:MAG: transposase [Ignavibacteriales bacterium]|nr:transposase [Ignavibacteriales bacterium]
MAGFVEPAPARVFRRHPLSEIVRSFKTFSSRRTNIIRATPRVPLWQRNFYDHVIRNRADLHRIRAYIEMNATRWASDEENL